MARLTLQDLHEPVSQDHGDVVEPPVSRQHHFVTALHDSTAEVAVVERRNAEVFSRLISKRRSLKPAPELFVKFSLRFLTA